MIRRPPRSPLFPSPPLFRSREQVEHERRDHPAEVHRRERVAHERKLRAAPPDEHDRDEERSEHDGRLRRAAARHADRKSTRLNSSHANISYAVFCLKKKKNY